MLKLKDRTNIAKLQKIFIHIIVQYVHFIVLKVFKSILKICFDFKVLKSAL
jgi:hypothetical protein